ncbi:MAG TPA: N4-gp56 family major capsid protein [Rhodocyclaceae bacterium]|nr:N4-gp56 family major capsid protein [Rhodocyclaceae bacterium]HMW78548.1 N4-gp56 family major capsid protein [Rhodocyclaceae bacterium]
MPTSIPYGSNQAVRLQSVGLFAASMQRQTLINRITGQLPKQPSAENTLRWQSDNAMPIVRCMDLTKTAGDEITIDLINPIGGKPVMGEQNIEGKGDRMSFSDMALKINQSRKAISAGGKMTQQRTPHDLRKLARAQGDGYMKRLEDQLCMVHLAGARGFANDAMWAVPLETDADYTDIVVNSVRTPTYNRHYVATGSGLAQAADSTNGWAAASLASTDVMDLDAIDALRSMIDDMAFPPTPIMLPGDEAAMDDPLYLLMVSAPQYESIKKSDSAAFRTFQAAAHARASISGQHPLFRGEVGLWNGILVKKMSRPIRFGAGNSVKYWPAASRFTANLAEASMSTQTVGVGVTVDRALLLGGQALAEAYGKTRQTGNPYFWSEKELDHGDKVEVAIGMIGGKSKVRFRMDHGSGAEDTDFGVIAIDTAVSVV